MQALYEASLSGSVSGQKLYQAVLDRLTLNTETPSTILHWREVTFERRNAQSVTAHEDSNALICRKDLQGPKGTWLVLSYGKPEPARLYPDAVVRPAVYSVITGSALAFASTLGYDMKSETYKRGFQFTRGIVTICLFQHDKINSETSQPEKADEDAVWTIEARAPPRTKDLAIAVDALLEVRTLMKGLVDLERYFV